MSGGLLSQLLDRVGLRSSLISSWGGWRGGKDVFLFVSICVDLCDLRGRDVMSTTGGGGPGSHSWSVRV